ncbi:hypothetical protein ACH5RR_002817 [Cinchona calisaya]|uniref:Uncharacterized protein n=1 Tax=Cinchona calisaya TaxID=153742 RepID=A0ABD3AT44_9GENT
MKFIQEQFKKKIIIGEQTLVMEKRLSADDVRKHLTISPRLLQHNPKVLRDEVKFGKQKTKSANRNAPLSYVLLSKEWKDIAEKNDLRAGEIVQLWAVRVEEALWFVLLTENSAGYRSKESYNLK